MKMGYSNWRQELTEVMTDKEDDKKVTEKKVKNKIVINPKLGEAVEALGGELLEMVEMVKPEQEQSPQEKEKEDPKQKKISQVKKQVLMKKMQAVRQGAGADIVAHYEPEGEVVEATYPSDFIDPRTGKAKAVANSKKGMPKAQVPAKKELDEKKGCAHNHKGEECPVHGKKECPAMVEETEDSLRDRRMERGGVDGNTRYDRAPKAPNTKKFGSGKTMAQKEMEKKYGKGASAMDIVKAQIRAKHGKGAIMDTKKK